MEIEVKLTLSLLVVSEICTTAVSRTAEFEEKQSDEGGVTWQLAAPKAARKSQFCWSDNDLPSSASGPRF
jgi:hypothetical protein